MNVSWKSKTFWAAVCIAVIGFLEAVGVSVPVYVLTILSGLGLYGVRSAIAKGPGK